MLFTSIIFLFFFFPLCIMGYYTLYFLQRKLSILAKFRLTDLCIVIASIGFYSWACFLDVFRLLLFCVIVYGFGYLIQKKENTSQNKIGIAAAAGVLTVSVIFFYYKYLNFSINLINNYTGTSWSTRNIMAPLGTSFIAFSAISYLLDIKRGDASCGDLLDTIIYILFFPKVISGPIVLWKEFRPQLTGRFVTVDDFMEGINRIIIGMAKKLILADEFGQLLVYIQSDVGYGIDVWTAVGGGVIYTLQIYYDFSGYSDMAIGLARLFGFKIKENFDFPYVSKSITEFWRRWHISLGRWFREYIYIPLGGNRRGMLRTLVNLFIIFLLTGIWHEDGRGGIHYIVWGVLHGICVITERCIADKQWYKKTPGAIKHLVTMFIIFVTWQIFRLDLDRAVYYLKIMFGQVKFDFINFTYQYYFDYKMICLIIIGILGATALKLDVIQALACKMNSRTSLLIIKESLLILLAVLSVMCMVNSTYSPFIYFQY